MNHPIVAMAHLRAASVVVLLLGGCIAGSDDGYRAALAPGALVETLVLETDGVFAAAVAEPVGRACGRIPGGSASMHEHPWKLVSTAASPGSVVTNITLTLTSHVVGRAGANADSDLELLDPAGQSLGRTRNPNLLMGETESILHAGPLATGTYTVRVMGCLAANGDWTVRGEAEIRMPAADTEA